MPFTASPEGLVLLHRSDVSVRLPRASASITGLHGASSTLVEPTSPWTVRVPWS